MIREVGFPEYKESGDVTHQVVVNPQAAHRVMDRRIDAHRHLIGVLAGDALVHFEEVAVAVFDHISTEAVDGISKVEIDTLATWANSPAIIARFFGST